jgi:hypothetical protein
MGELEGMGTDSMGLDAGIYRERESGRERRGGRGPAVAPSTP